MLLELTIRDFAIIDEIRVSFEPGFNALTGETGAGKSILIDALGAVLGDRVGADLVRTGAKLARVEATFEVGELLARPDVTALFAELGVEPEDGLLILGREVMASGRSSARINGRTATAGMLNRIGGLLVDVHGQSDHLNLLRPAAHLEVLDRFAGLEEPRTELAARVAHLWEIRARINEIETGARERAQRIDLLRFQIGEIEAAALRPGEEEDLLRERTILTNAEQLATSANAAVALLAGGEDAFDPSAVPVVAAVRQVRGLLGELAALDPSVADLAIRAEEALDGLEDLAAEIRTYGEAIEADPRRLESVEDRLDLLKGLKRKYGRSAEEIIAFGEDAARELERLTGGEAGVDGLKEQETLLRDEVGQRASSLSAARCAASATLARAVEQAIADLNMGRARFAVSISQADDPAGVPFNPDGATLRSVAVDASGADRVEFMIAPNAGEALKPLGRIASGGEMARLMLALKSILSEADATPTLVFDEVDVGVGGRSGQVVGEKLAGLAATHQVLAITHLPQIAAFADAHFQIRKGERAGRVTSDIAPLEEPQRIEELAAMLAGQPVTSTSRANAVELLGRVQTWRAARDRPDAARKATSATATLDRRARSPS